MRYYINNQLDPSFNLAFEEEIILSDFFLPEEPVFCLWRNKPSVIIGVSQVVDNEVNVEFCNESGIPIVKRHTGGGAVYHDLGNMNFSFFFHSRPDCSPYSQVFSFLKPVFRKLGLEICLSKTNDILLNNGKKFSGMAERVIGNRIMVHGTMLYDTDISIMARALTTEKSKFSKPKGVASRHAVVTNLKDYLKDIKNILEFTDYLREELATPDVHSGLLNMPNEFLDKVKVRAYKDYMPLNLKYTGR